jgi:sulfur relay (sulfurtransferase) complex TusBCD TusD component (DsrE family)
VTHMVIFRRADGSPGQHQAENLEEATRFVESLRNRENVTDSRIFFMQEVPIEFKAVYKVEVVATPATAAAPAATDEAPAADDAEAPARTGIFSRT